MLNRLFLSKLSEVQERTGAKTLFLTPDDLPTSLATTLSSTVTTTTSRPAVSTDEPRPAAAPGKAGRLMTAEEKERVKAAIVNASSAEEVRKLERSLKEGWVPNV
jgi:U2 small nuclear ribonucleoprotein A'